MAAAVWSGGKRINSDPNNTDTTGGGGGHKLEMSRRTTERVRQRRDVEIRLMIGPRFGDE